MKIIKVISLLLFIGLITINCKQTSNNTEPITSVNKEKSISEKINGVWISKECGYEKNTTKITIENDGNIIKVTISIYHSQGQLLSERKFTGSLEGNKIKINSSSIELLYSDDSKTIYFKDCELKQ